MPRTRKQQQPQVPEWVTEGHRAIAEIVQSIVGGMITFVRVRDRATGAEVTVIAAATVDGIIPIARLFAGNPNDEVVPPSPCDDPNCPSCSERRATTTGMLN